MELNETAVLVTEIDGFQAGDPGYCLRFYQDLLEDEWFVEFWPVWRAAVRPQEIQRFIQACLSVLKAGVFADPAQFFDDGYVSGSVLAEPLLDDAGSVWLAVDLDVDFRQDLAGYDGKGRPLYRPDARAVSIAPGCRFESTQNRDRLLGRLRALRARIDGLDLPEPSGGTVPVTEFAFRAEGGDDPLRLGFHHDEADDRWLVSLRTERSICEPVAGFPVRLLPLTHQGLRRFVDAYGPTSDATEVPAETRLVHYYDHELVISTFSFAYDDDTQSVVDLAEDEIDLRLAVRCRTGSELTGRSSEGEPLFAGGHAAWNADFISLQNSHRLRQQVAALRTRLEATPRPST
ncbi:hypothetical protein [Spirillospora sp. NPDC047279]|uniref:hypothetical protein n=1 Tax=Spirillospora sp. NPDC047279 TaxID=3155478 RepID=UPI0034010351